MRVECVLPQPQLCARWQAIGPRIPSFHYYPRNQFDNSLQSDGALVEKHFAKSGLPHVFLRGKAINDFSEFFAHRSREEYQEVSRIYSELLTFLDLHLAASQQ